MLNMVEIAKEFLEQPADWEALLVGFNERDPR